MLKKLLLSYSKMQTTIALKVVEIVLNLDENLPEQMHDIFVGVKVGLRASQKLFESEEYGDFLERIGMNPFSYSEESWDEMVQIQLKLLTESFAEERLELRGPVTTDEVAEITKNFQ